ncbi:hypothetical protein [Methylocapsa polymorpha]
MGLAEARKATDEARRILRSGRNPVDVKRAAKERRRRADFRADR